MNKTLLVLFLSFSALPLFSQNKIYLIELKNKNFLSEFDFFCSRVVDNRENNLQLGEVLIGEPPEVRNAIFKEDFL